MKKYVFIYFVFIAVLLLLSCKPKPALVEESPSNIKPFTIIIEKQIKGKILGLHLNKPFGLAKDEKGKIYLSDSENSRIIRFSSQLVPELDIGGFGKQAGLLNKPAFLTFDNGLNLVVSNEQNRRLSRYTLQLNFVEDIIFDDEEDPLRFGLPSGVAFTDYGEMWVADRENNQIAIFASDGKFEKMLGEFGYTGGELASPEKIIKDKAGNFIVCDAGNGRLVFYDDYGNFLREISHDKFEYPIAVAYDKEKLWVLDGSAGKIICLNHKGTMLFKFGPVLLGDHLHLNEPSDILLLDDNRLVITDTGNNRLLLCKIIEE